jgi:hypothetical protein
MPKVPAWQFLFGIAVTVVCTPTIATAAPCPNEALRGLTGRSLPDCRAYEQVSPPAKNGNDVGQTLTVPVYVAASDGMALAFETIGDLPGGSSATVLNENLSRRGPSGWTTLPISPPQSPRKNVDWPVFQYFTPNLNKAFVRTPPGPNLATGDVVGGTNLYLRDNDTGRYFALSVGTPADHPASATYNFGGASSDLSHVIFESDDALTPDAPSSFPDAPNRHPNLYEWVGGQLRLVTILPDGTPAPTGGGTGVAGGASDVTQVIDHVISPDGSRIVFGTPVDAPPDGAQIYIRKNGQQTIAASRSRRGSADPAVFPPKFWGASTDVSKVYFTSGSALTDDAALGSSSLYRYDVDADMLTNVTANPLGSGLSSVQGVLGMSDDGSYVYFSDKSTYFADQGVEGASNLYVLHGDTLRFIATGDPLDNDDLQADRRTFRVTPDGRHLVFTSTQSLTGYDNTDAVTGLPDREVFLYDAVADTLKCVSCRPDGKRPTGSAALPAPPQRYRLNRQRSVTDDGRRVFFDTSDALVPADVNGKLDAYMYEDGSPYLVSSGTDGDGSSFAGASSSGDDVFFVTRQRLTGTDTDENLDVYDARVGGGFPDPQPQVPCSGDGCQPAPTPPSASPSLASPFILGEGNAARSVPPAASFRLAAITKTERQKAARTGVLRLSVRVSEGGILKGRASARLNGRSKTVGSAVTHALRAGTAQLRLRLAKALRKELARRRTVSLSVRVTFSHASHAKTLTLELHR